MLLSVANLAKTFGPDTVLDGVSFRIAAREKVALVGRNGTGKTSLLKLISGEEQPDSGSINLARGTRVGYLSQISPVPSGMTVLSCAQQSVEAKLHLAQRLRELEEIIESGSASDEDIEEYGLVHEHFLDVEGYAIERDTETVLGRLGFTKEEFAKPTDVLSGGERTRLALSRLLLDEPDLLILDEPTNHLDLDATAWLESWVRGYHGAVLIVSHDRTFLDSTAERYLLLQEHKILEFPGPFEKFQKLKKDAELRQAEVAAKQQREIEKLDEFVRRFMNSQRTAQARGRLKLMNRLIATKTDAPKNEKQMKGAFTGTKRTGDQVFQIEKAVKAFDDQSLFQNLNWAVHRGEKWGVIGENGAGKSTLIRCLLGLEPLSSGYVRLGSNLEIGYFSQDASDLDKSSTPLEVVSEITNDFQSARNLLGRFLISGEDAMRSIETFSGGEKNKISLARLVALKPNVLVLDEPTNHLDMDSREALGEVLREFDGTLVLVSHDRWLLTQLTNHILELRTAGITTYPGNYAEFTQRRNLSDPQPKANVPTQVATIKTLTPREISKEIERLEREIASEEANVSEQEAKLRRIESELESPSAENLRELIEKHSKQKSATDEAVHQWENLATKLENLRSLQGAAASRELENS